MLQTKASCAMSGDRSSREIRRVLSRFTGPIPSDDEICPRYFGCLDLSLTSSIGQIRVLTFIIASGDVSNPTPQ
jgi:hypothetical protein